MIEHQLWLEMTFHESLQNISPCADLADCRIVQLEPSVDLEREDKGHVVIAIETDQGLDRKGLRRFGGCLVEHAEVHDRSNATHQAL